MENKYSYIIEKHIKTVDTDTVMGCSLDLEKALAIAGKVVKEWEKGSKERDISIVIAKAPLDICYEIHSWDILYVSRGVELYKLNAAFDRLRKEDNPNGF